MQFFVIGLNHRTASLPLRERLALNGDEAATWLEAHLPDLPEAVLLSTCNRTEIYALAADPEEAGLRVAQVLAAHADMAPAQLTPHLYRRTGRDALLHLLRVASGLDSQVLGETQILGQVREAYLAAVRCHSAGTIMNMVFQSTLAAAKRVHVVTEVSHKAVSVGYAAAELARRTLSDPHDRMLLMIGAGKMAELCLQNLREAGFTRVVVVNRTAQRARELAGRLGAEAAAFDRVDTLLREADAVITSTSAPHIVLDREMMARAMRARGRRPLLCVDLGVPRDIAPEVSRLAGVTLRNIDQLQDAIQENLKARARAAVQAQQVLEDAANDLLARLQARRAAPLIRSLRNKAEDVRRQELERVLRRLPELTPHQRAVLESTTALIVNRILNDPTLALREVARSENADAMLSLASTLFGVRPQDVQG